MPILEIAVAVNSLGPSRVQRGDIVAARVPTGIIGKKEGRDFLWMTIDTDSTIEELTAPGKLGEKRNVSVDVDTLYTQKMLSKARAEDTGDEYQPLLGQKEDAGKFNLLTVKG